jgi:hypothetical protein
MQICIGETLGANVLLDFGGPALTNQIRLSEHVNGHDRKVASEYVSETDGFYVSKAVNLMVDRLMARVSETLLRRGMKSTADSVTVMFQDECRNPGDSEAVRLVNTSEFAHEIQHHYFQEI